MESALRSVSPTRAQELFDAYHRHEHVVQGTLPFPTYKHVLTESLRRAAEDAGVDLDTEQTAVLATTLPTWPVFPETPQALRSLHDDGWKLGILSNVDNDLIEQTLVQLREPIDLVITAEDIGSYKPGLAHFEQFRERSGVAPGRWIHVACSWFHDVEPPARLGVPSVFINREREVRDTGVAAAVMTDLVGLAETVAEVFQRTTGRTSSAR
jgi:2-haloacid dehalogenase